MNKSQLINKVSAHSCMSKIIVNRVLNVITSAIIRSLKNGDNVSLMGFGTFLLRTRMSRIIKNPKTGEMIFVKESKVPAFRSGKKLKNSVN